MYMQNNVNPQDLSVETCGGIHFMKSILPKHYKVEESKTPGSIHCLSKIGIRKDTDAEDEKLWNFIFTSIEKYFGDRFQEVYHNVCFCHTDFTVYLKTY